MGLDEALEARLDADDHDLLTYNEVKIRLLEEIAEEERKLENLKNDEARTMIERRIELLREAAVRNMGGPDNIKIFESFWGYKPNPE
ncbi:acyl-CoA synthetase [Rhodococcus sp. 5G237]